MWKNVNLWHRVVVLCLALVVMLSACWHPEEAQPKLSKAGVYRLPIIGGKPDLRHPEVGALTTNQRTFCTGTLIAKRVVLTAAHCVDAAVDYAKSQTVQFRIDAPDSSNSEGFVKKYFDFDVKLFQNHPKWNKNLSNGGDVAVGILKSKVTIATPMPANLTPLSSSWVGRKMLFLGYGLIQSTPSSISPNRKYGVEIPITDLRDDRFTHTDKGKSVCHGDSGGPAIYLVNGRLRVIGVNSYVNAPRVPGTTRSTCTGTGTSMRTDTFTAFIQSVLNTYGDGPETCEKDGDCGQCGQCNTGKKLCEPVSLPVNDKVCKPCSSDSDCGTGRCYRFNDGFRCLQPCSTKNCCPSQHYCAPLKTQTGIHSLCMPFANACEPLACSRDKDCGPGEYCENGFCLPRTVARHPDLCKPCKESKDCGTSFCYGLPGQKHCTQACGAGDFCPPGYVCSQPFPGVSKHCTPITGDCQIPCMFNANCPAEQVCVQGVCRAKEGGGYGAACDPGQCKSPLTCTTTISGKRCLQPCNHPAKYAGSRCSGSSCNSGLSCFSLTSDLRLCLKGCNSSADCRSQGGGQCSSGICFCFSDTQCESGYVCNQNSSQLGACAPRDQQRKCDSPLTCSPFEGESYCIDNNAGTRSLGQPCDPLNRCRTGLLCISTTDGGICFEDCSKTRSCELGGVCSQFGNSTRLCVCRGTSDCPKGRSCRPYIQQGLSQYGLCEFQGLSNPCIGDKECPTGFVCRRGNCITPEDAEKLPPDEPEMTEEPAPEAGPEAAPEPEPAVEKPSPPEAGPEPPPEAQNKESGSSEVAPEAPEGGCQCQASVSGNFGAIPLLMWAGLMLIGFRVRRKETR